MFTHTGSFFPNRQVSRTLAVGFTFKDRRFIPNDIELASSLSFNAIGDGGNTAALEEGSDIDRISKGFTIDGPADVLPALLRICAMDSDASPAAPAAAVTITARTIPFNLEGWTGSGRVEVRWYNASYMTGSFTAAMDHEEEAMNQVKGVRLLEAEVQAELGYDDATSSYYAVGFITGFGPERPDFGSDGHVGYFFDTRTGVVDESVTLVVKSKGFILLVSRGTGAESCPASGQEKISGMFAYDSGVKGGLKLPKTKHVGVYNCANPDDEDVIRYVFTAKIPGTASLSDDGSIKVKDATAVISAKGKLVDGITDYTWTVNIAGAVQHSFAGLLKVYGMAEATVVRDPAYGSITVRDVVVTAGVAMALGESGAPAIVIEGELNYVFPCIDFVTFDVAVKLRFAQLLNLTELRGNVRAACPDKVSGMALNDPVFTLTVGNYAGELPAKGLPEGLPASVEGFKMGDFTGSLNAYRMPSALDDVELPELDCLGTYAGASECEAQGSSAAHDAASGATEGVPRWIPFNIDYTTLKWSGKISSLVKAEWPEASSMDVGALTGVTQKKYVPAFKLPFPLALNMPEFITPDGAFAFDAPDMSANFTATLEFNAAEPKLAGVDGVGMSVSFGELGNLEDFTDNLKIDLESVVPLDIVTPKLAMHLKASVSGAKCPVDGYPASGDLWLNTDKAKGRVMVSGARFCADDRETDWVMKGSLAELTIGDDLDLQNVEFTILATSGSQPVKKGRSLSTVSEAMAEAKYSQDQAKAYADGGAINTESTEAMKDIQEIERTEEEAVEEMDAGDAYAQDLAERAVATDAHGHGGGGYVKGKTVDFEKEKYANQDVTLRVEMRGTVRLGSVMSLPWAGAIPATVTVGFVLEPGASEPKFEDASDFASSVGFVYVRATCCCKSASIRGVENISSAPCLARTL
jgi:hypothetical protein